MKVISQRTAIVSILISTIIFGLALAAFCYALGLDFTNEGWAKPAGDATTIVKHGWLIAAVAGFGVSTVLFFIGLHRITRS